MADTTTEDPKSFRFSDADGASGDFNNDFAGSSCGGFDTSDPFSMQKSNRTDFELKDKITQKETQAVFRLRLWVMRVLLLTGVAVSLVVYSMTRTSQLQEFSNIYNGAANQILSSVLTDMTERMGQVAALSAAYTTSTTPTAEEDWPFVTLPHFHQQAQKVRHSSGALFVRMAPYVRTDQLDEWHVYVNSSDHNSWIDVGHQSQEIKGINDLEYEPNVARSRLANWTKVDPLHYFDAEGIPFQEDAGGPYLPTWQTSPVFYTSYVNENMLRQSTTSMPEQVLDVVLEEQQALLGGLLQAPPGRTDHANPQTAFFATLRSFSEGGQALYEGDPMANLYVPVFDNFLPQNQTTTVAVISATFQWQDYFKNVLPSNVNGIVVVLDNHCDGYYTYELFGPDVVLKGSGDLHNPRFDQYQRKTALVMDRLDDGTDVGGVEVSHSDCIYTIHVYPSQMYYDEYINNVPLAITACIAGLFVFATVIFMVYNKVVEHRQTVVLAKATTSTAIVTSLFPKNVTDRLLENEANNGQGTKKGGDTQKDKLRGFLNGKDSDDDQGKPIADLFPKCTVFFGDIAGFTSWSSNREPTEVFILLQELYKAFDDNAKRRRVFKVETIGDCYMAVTGLPEPQKHHATTMVRFAWECQAAMREITKKLADTLGKDTLDLDLRTGLHSGPVTAGVLRGDRARFQLFGDTVNTASRMESTSERGCIQLSSSTAALIRRAGKGNWLKPREDPVKAKGKGLLYTFWAIPPQEKMGGSGTLSRSESMTDMQSYEDSDNSAGQVGTGKAVNPGTTSSFDDSVTSSGQADASIAVIQETSKDGDSVEPPQRPAQESAPVPFHQMSGNPRGDNNSFEEEMWV